MWVCFLTMIGTEFMCYLFFGRGGGSKNIWSHHSYKVKKG